MPKFDRVVEVLRGRGAADLVARINAHPLAPRGETAHKHQLAMILATSRPSKWRAAAEAVARELELVDA